MTLNITYFGMLTEVTQCKAESLTFSGETVSDLLKLLFEKYPQLEEKEFRVAQDSMLVSEQSPITNPLIALLPPFAGG